MILFSRALERWFIREWTGFKWLRVEPRDSKPLRHLRFPTWEFLEKKLKKTVMFVIS
jgi:hypothetical protein